MPAASSAYWAVTVPVLVCMRFRLSYEKRIWRGAAELPAANVTVVLDGRFAVRTDSLGNYAFPDVAVGRHTISVVADNLPLPWSFEEADAARTVEVEVRRSVRVDIGARRPQ